MKKYLASILFLAFLAIIRFPFTTLAAYNGEGIGILSDSNSDEYRADDNRGGPYATTTLNWVELLVKKRSLNFGAWGTWGDNRRTGYKYNWAKSGNLTRDLIDSGQAIGLANQIQSGEVKYVFIHIGVNDFNFWNQTYDAVYNNTIDINSKVNEIINKMNQAIDIIKQAGNTKIVMTSLGDPGVFPPIATLYPDPIKRARVTNAINTINVAWKAKADANNISFINLDVVMLNNVISKIDSSGDILIGGEKIHVYIQNNEPHYFRLGDSAGHLGTVANGIMANLWFTQPFNTNYSLNISPFNEYEMLTNAGILTAPTPTSTSSLSPTPTPLNRPCTLIGDTNSCDGVVNALDFTYLSSKFGTNDPKADLKQDGIINVLDYSILSANFGKTL